MLAEKPVDRRVAQMRSAEPAADRPAPHVMIADDFDRPNVPSCSGPIELKKETRWPDYEPAPAASPQLDKNNLDDWLQISTCQSVGRPKPYGETARAIALANPSKG